jgi:hypothetical protein
LDAEVGGGAAGDDDLVVAVVPFRGDAPDSGDGCTTPRVIAPGAGTAGRRPAPVSTPTKNSSDAARTAAAAFTA